MSETTKTNTKLFLSQHGEVARYAFVPEGHIAIFEGSVPANVKGMIYVLNAVDKTDFENKIKL